MRKAKLRNLLLLIVAVFVFPIILAACNFDTGTVTFDTRIAANDPNPAIFTDPEANDAVGTFTLTNVSRGDTITAPTVQREGYTVAHWYTSPRFRERDRWYFQTNTVTRRNTRLYARFVSLHGQLVFTPNPVTAGEAPSFSIARAPHATIQNLTIPETWQGIPVTRVANEGFRAPSGTTAGLLRHVTFSRNITHIGESAFFEQNELEHITFPQDSRLVNIGTNAFGGSATRRNRIRNIQFPGSLEVIGSGAFQNSRDLISVSFGEPSSLREIGGRPLNQQGTGLLTSPTGAFDNAHALTSFEFPSTLERIGPRAFNATNSLTDIDLTNTNIKELELEALGGTRITNFYIPPSLERIGPNAFRDSSAMRSIGIHPDLRDVEYSLDEVVRNAFANSPSLQRLEFPDSLTTFDAFTTIPPSPIRHITFNSVVNEGYLNFLRPTGVRDLVIFVKDEAMRNAYLQAESPIHQNHHHRLIPLDTMRAQVGNRTFGVIYGYDNDPSQAMLVEELAGNKIDIILYLGRGASEITLDFDSGNILGLDGNPVTLNSINANAFSQTLYLRDLTIINTTNGGFTVGNNAFAGSNFLERVTLEGVTTIGDRAFETATRLENISFGSDLEHIGENAFAGSTRLTSVTFPASLISIGGSAFSNMPSLTSAVFTNAVNLRAIGSSAFRQTRIAVVDLSNAVQLRTLGSTAWSATYNDFVDTVTPLAAGLVFSANINLTEVHLPPNLRIINDSTFSGATSLRQVTIPASVEIIARDAFSGNTALSRVEFDEPNSSLVAIYARAFNQNTSLQQIALPTSLNYLSINAFNGCTNLKLIEVNSFITFFHGDGVNNYNPFTPPATNVMQDYEGLATLFIQNPSVTDGRLNRDTNGHLRLEHARVVVIHHDIIPVNIDGTHYDVITTDDYGNITHYANIDLKYLIGRLTPVRAFTTDHLRGEAVEGQTPPSRVFSFLVVRDDEYLNLDRGVLFGTAPQTGSDTEYDLVLHSFFGIDTHLTLNNEDIFRFFPRRANAGVGVTIAPYAFANAFNLRNVIITPLASVIGHHAFLRCTGLREVKFIGDYHNTFTIGDNAFQAATNVENIFLFNVASIGRNVFLGWNTAQRIHVFHDQGLPPMSRPIGVPVNQWHGTAAVPATWTNPFGDPDFYYFFRCQNIPCNCRANRWDRCNCPPENGGCGC